MKRWELAKKEGLNWQAVLIQDCETDIKVITLESIRLNEDYGTINKKVTSLIKECIEQLESPTLKVNCKVALYKYATRIYLQLLALYGNREMGLSILAFLFAKGVRTPDSYKAKIEKLPSVKEWQAPDYVYNRATPNATYTKDYEGQVINRILDTVAKEDYAERYSLRASAERQIRFEWHEKSMQDLRDKGIKLVWIDTHANCSERCQPYQGRLYSLDGTKGVIDGISYEPIEVATEVYEVTKSGKQWRNGCLSGFNCRHTTSPYKKGSKPAHIPEDVLERQRAIEKRQRELERTVRKYETRLLGYRALKKTEKNKEKAQAYSIKCKHYKELIDKWQSEYIAYSNKNNVPYYPSRLKI